MSYPLNQEVKRDEFKSGMDHDRDKEKEGNPEDRYF